MRRRRFFLVAAVIAGVLVVGGSLAYAFREPLVWYMMKPSVSFDEQAPPPAPDYRDDASWAALPELADPADVVPVAEGVEDEQANAVADVFFVHPTTYYSSDGWNQPLDDDEANSRTDRGVLRNQASAFNACCRVFAPRYRQATLYAFVDDEGNYHKALELAYRDVERAFLDYLEHRSDGRPFVLASHSQGSYHALRLLEDHVSHGAVRERLVAAYLVGLPLPLDKLTRTLPDIPLCESPAQTGCVMTWNTVAEGVDLSGYGGQARFPYDGVVERNGTKPIVCVNPLTWLADERPADRSLNLGGAVFLTDHPTLDAEIADAHCRDGFLYISPPKLEIYTRLMLAPQNFHVYDYHLFYMNVRENAVARVREFVGAVSP